MDHGQRELPRDPRRPPPLDAEPPARPLQSRLDGRRGQGRRAGGRRLRAHARPPPDRLPHGARAPPLGAGPRGAPRLADQHGAGRADQRPALGVHVEAIGMERPRRPQSLDPGDAPCALRSYDLLLAHSAYVARWIRTWWGLDSEVVHPAVAPVATSGTSARPGRAALDRGRRPILHEGHSKCQADLVSAFRSMHDTGLDDWQPAPRRQRATAALGRRYLERVQGPGRRLPDRASTPTPREATSNAGSARRRSSGMPRAGAATRSAIPASSSTSGSASSRR